MRFDLDLIDRSFPAILSALGWTPARSTERRITGACPLHHGKDANFHIDLQPDGKWLAICRSQCGGSGWTATRFTAAYFNLPHPEAIEKAAKLAGISPREDTPAHSTPGRPRAHIPFTFPTTGKDTGSAHIGDSIARQRDSILSPYLSTNWHADLWDSSEIIIPPSHDEQARLMLRHLFEPKEILWMGNEFDSGQPHHAENFRTRDAWLEAVQLPPRIAAGAFRTGSYSRSAASLTSSPFIIIESDDLIGRKPITPEEREENRARCAALIAFMVDGFRLTLRAVIDTAGKSLHGWFDRPSDAALEALAGIAEALAIDPQVIARAHGPLRLPGCIHSTTGQPARLCYLNPRSY